jgi:hypothetical protein
VTKQSCFPLAFELLIDDLVAIKANAMQKKIK